MSAVRIHIPETPGPEHRDAVLSRLQAFNADHGFASDHRPLALMLVDGAGATVGGLWGGTGYDWLFVDFLFVPEALRGQDLGLELMARAEAIARERGCVGAWLTTFSFQAKGFYEKIGYSEFARLENSPRDNARILMRKRLAEESAW